MAATPAAAAAGKPADGGAAAPKDGTPGPGEKGEPSERRPPEHVPYKEFADTRHRMRAAETTITRMDEFLAANPDLAAAIQARMSGAAAAAPPAAAAAEGGKHDADPDDAMRRAVAKELLGDDRELEDLDRIERLYIEDKVKEKKAHETEKRRAVAQSVAKLQADVEAVIADPFFKEFEIDADELVAYMNKENLFHPRKAAFDMHQEKILDRERRAAAEEALRRKGAAAERTTEIVSGAPPATPPRDWKEETLAAWRARQSS